MYRDKDKITKVIWHGVMRYDRTLGMSVAFRETDGIL